jgi:exosortase N
MGLQMIITSLLCAAILISIFQRRFSKRLPLFHILFVMSAIAILNIGSNIFRMAVLVLLLIPPTNPAHDIVGIATLLLYVLVPAVYGIKWAVPRFGKPIQEIAVINCHKPYSWIAGSLLVIIAVSLLHFAPSNDRFKVVDRIALLPGTTATTLNDHIIRQSSKELLLYIKPIPSFYFSDHQPMICWRGSGFEFNRVEEKIINNRKIFQAVLKKPDATLYTAWWYESKDKYSNSQINWRWDALRNNAHYYLMNVTVSNPEMLSDAVKQVMSARLIR